LAHMWHIYVLLMYIFQYLLFMGGEGQTLILNCDMVNTNCHLKYNIVGAIIISPTYLKQL
jgi:hypothetical protein